MKYYLSIDGGGTKIDAVIFDENLKIHSQLTYNGGINARTLASEVVENNIVGCLNMVKDAAPDIKFEKIYGFFMHNQEIFARHASAIIGCGNVEALQEGVQGLLCGGLYPNGVLLLCGTGSDAFVIKDGATVDIIGGWGAVLGDEGSGYSIGKAAMNAAIAYYEQRAPYTMLYDAVINKYPAETFRKSVYGIYSSKEPVRAVASFAKDAEEAADKGDGIAISIFEDAAAALADIVITAYKKHDLPKDFPLTFTGGLLKHDIKRENPLIFGKLRAILEKHGITNLSIDIFPPVFGGVISHAYSTSRTEKDIQI